MFLTLSLLLFTHFSSPSHLLIIIFQVAADGMREMMFMRSVLSPGTSSFKLTASGFWKSSSCNNWQLFSLSSLSLVWNERRIEKTGCREEGKEKEGVDLLFLSFYEEELPLLTRKKLSFFFSEMGGKQISSFPFLHLHLTQRGSHFLHSPYFLLCLNS